MKIHNFVQDVRQMELAELQAINLRVQAVQATSQFNESEDEHVIGNELYEKTKKTQRSKKIKKEV